MDIEQIKEFLAGETGKELKEFLIKELKELKNIDSLREYDTPTTQSIEIRAQKKAFEKLKTILSKLIDIEEINETKPEKDNYFA